MQLIVRHLSVYHNGVAVLTNVSTYFETGEITMVIGPNGSGKSTLLKALAGLVKYEGEIILPDGYEAVDELTGYVFQNPETQIIGSTVFEDVIFGLENIGLAPTEIEKRANYVLELLELSNLRDSDPYYLSGGQKQRLAIASILALEPEFLLLDEVTAMLDKSGKREVLEAIVRLKNLNKGIVVATHELDLFSQIADRCIYIRDGRIVFDGQPADGIEMYKREMGAEFLYR
ncbi:energy-coupling factor ABC transporter ATP-binding protein [Fervidobacterium thailandense]|uniref:ABC transporter n=1 Tax=Fervidobacterium thailandense TaxID=1008305 RepID=A0A1E3G1R1_9BACT|nr:energy-coupling factor ABC transporter ATP-binding protein [Fervidobacterium thailandense]ODN29793.1 ABC transporter [Fervidobacterium thailandense]